MKNLFFGGFNAIGAERCGQITDAFTRLIGYLWLRNTDSVEPKEMNRKFCVTETKKQKQNRWTASHYLQHTIISTTRQQGEIAED